MKKRDYKELKKIFCKDDASSLSDMIGLHGEGFRYIEVKYIKKFIKKLKTELTDAKCCPKLWMIDELAGKDLI